MSFQIETTSNFVKSLKKLQPFEQKMVAQKISQLCKDMFHPSLRTKKVKGFEQLFECSVNMDIRILWRLKDSRIILLLNVGHHDIVDHL